MSEIKFLHFADLHLDVPFTSLGVDNGLSSVRRQDIKDTFCKIIDIAKEEEVQIILISGDFFEYEYVKKSTINFIDDKFKEIDKIKVFIIPGNHDPKLGNSFYHSFSWNENVHILDSNNSKIYLEDSNTYIHGAGFDGKGINKIEDLSVIDKSAINILLFHGTVDMNFKKLNYNSVLSKDLKESGMDYYALGHFHRRTLGVGGINNICYPGSPEPLGFDETGEHGVIIGKIQKQGIDDSKLEIRAVNTNKRFYEELDSDITNCVTDEQVIIKILDTLQDRDKEHGIYSVNLTGYIDREFKLNINSITDYFKDKFFYVKVNDETSADYNFEEIRNEAGIRGLFVNKMLGLMDKEKDEDKKKLLKKSLYLGLEAIDNDKIEL